MDISEIKNYDLINLVKTAGKYGSSTIGNDMGDAISESENEPDFVKNWKSKLETLRDESAYCISELERVYGDKK
jgi:hypothetical protein